MTDAPTKCGMTTTSPAAHAPTENETTETETTIDGIETEIEAAIGTDTGIETEGIEMVAETETETEVTEEAEATEETATETEAGTETVVEKINPAVPLPLALQTHTAHAPIPARETAAVETGIEQLGLAETAPVHHQNQSLPPHHPKKIWIQLPMMARKRLRQQWQQCWVLMGSAQQSRRK